MKTSLIFSAPEDLSAGRVTVGSEKGTVADWIATPDNKTKEIHDVEPGNYRATINVLGKASSNVCVQRPTGCREQISAPPTDALMTGFIRSVAVETPGERRGAKLGAPL